VARVVASRERAAGRRARGHLIDPRTGRSI
jgi:hypothetical protein